MMNDAEQMIFVPKTRLRREWRKWVKKIKAGVDVYETRCGKDPRGILLLSNEDWEWFMKEVERPPIPIPDAMKRAIKRHDLLIAPAPWEKKN